MSIENFPPETIGTTILSFVQSNLVTSALVQRQFEPGARMFGDVVNAKFLDSQKNLTKIATPLTDLATVAFRISLQDRSLSYYELCKDWFEPAAIALAEALDRSTLFRLAAQAGVKLGTPGVPFMDSFQELSPSEVLVVGTDVEAQLLHSELVMNRQKVNEATALDEANVSYDQIWMDQNTPTIMADLDYHGSFPGSGSYTSEEETRVDLGNMSVIFNRERAALCCRELPVMENQGVASFAGLSVRVTVKEEGPDSETGECWDLITVEALSGVGADPATTTVIYSS